MTLWTITWPVPTSRFVSVRTSTVPASTRPALGASAAVTVPGTVQLEPAGRSAFASVIDSEPNDGVFVRSDTNVEDLPGFTGAGLNKTIPNVVGYDAILQAIREVWASPFSDRAIVRQRATFLVCASKVSANTWPPEPSATK